MAAPSGPDKLRAWLRAADMSNRQLADRLGVSPSNVGRWLSGTWRPSIAYAMALHDLTGVEPSAWLPQEKKKAA